MKPGSKVKTLHLLYVGMQKDQKVQLTPLPAGSVGVVRHVSKVPDDTYCLVKFELNGKRYWAKVNPDSSVVPV